MNGPLGRRAERETGISVASRRASAERPPPFDSVTE